MNIIGIRREDKNRWERRAPLTPAQIFWLISRHHLRFQVQHSTIRAFPDSEYQQAGAEVREDLSDCPVTLGIKEMPIGFFLPERTYIFFAHVIKGQPGNMPMLRRLMELNCSLIDYEKVTDEQGRRLIFFGRYAGIAGMIDTLAGLGKRLAVQGIVTPFLEAKLAHEYERYEVARKEISKIGELIRNKGLPQQIAPLIIGVTGYGNVAKGAGEILSALGAIPVSPADLPAVINESDRWNIYQVTFKEEHLVAPVAADRSFDLQEYYHHPERYCSKFQEYLPYLSVLVNCIYWDNRYPRLVTRDYLATAFRTAKLRLIIIGDISCDIEGSIEATVKANEPGAPFFVYDPLNRSIQDGVEGSGIVIMAVDNLPCELAVDSSTEFGNALMPFIPALSATDFTRPLDRLELPAPLRRALILHQGRLTPEFQYLEKYVEKGRG
uniref:Saccharopine dehydrogenase (NAD(+), L-lysine-forming) n=1 Tax=candidate division WOR-3 bacterium TaxID=2052148 RepID=A0A7V3PS70_UNCW3